MNWRFNNDFVVVELYTYSEEPEFVWNAEAFNILFQAKCMWWKWEDYCEVFVFLIVGENKKWKDYSRDEKLDFIIYLLEQCELVDRTRRCQAMRAILYLIQGKFNLENFHLKISFMQVYFINVRIWMNICRMPKKMFYYCILVMVCIYLLICLTWKWISRTTNLILKKKIKWALF